MARNNKRVATKHIRDGIKAKYKKDSCCAICGITENLELHHYTTVSLLLKSYAEANGIPIATDEEVLAMRESFYKEYSYELIEDTVTLCKDHHVLLHKTYGRTPELHTASKQREWVKRRRDAEGVADVLPTEDTDVKEDIINIKDKPKRELALPNTCFDTESFKTLAIPLSEFKV